MRRLWRVSSDLLNLLTRLVMLKGGAQQMCRQRCLPLLKRSKICLVRAAFYDSHTARAAVDPEASTLQK